VTFESENSSKKNHKMNLYLKTNRQPNLLLSCKQRWVK